jgi:hypothetical protein
MKSLGHNKRSHQLHERIGLEPFHAPEPLPPIQMEDVHLICWMAIELEKTNL